MEELKRVAGAVALAAALCWPGIAGGAEGGETLAAVMPSAVPVVAPDTEIGVRLQPSTVQVMGEPVHAGLLRRFYAPHAFMPVWPAHPAAAAALTAAVQRAGEHGLDPSRYHLRLLANPAVLPPADRDLLLSDAFLSYADALVNGAVPFSERLDDEDLRPEPVDVAAVLDSAIAAPDPAGAIEALAPRVPAYAALRQALARYRAAAAGGGWQPVSAGSPPAVIARRLTAEGYDPAHYGGEAHALRAFQHAHALPPDGRLGLLTLAELNVPADERAHQIAVNLERLRWLPRLLPPDRVVVNTADARLTLFRADRAAFTTRVVVGQADKQTPEFQATIESVLFNPPWNVPPSIARSEILPKLAADPDYLARHNMVFRHGGGIQQLPGHGTALGQLKFEMPNRYDVYLHDTPLKNLFSLDNRRKSHGCVRVENPRELAALLLQTGPDEIGRGIAIGQTHRRYLPQSVPVVIVYQTAFPDDDGTIAFRRDVYDRDPEVWRGLGGVVQTPLAEQANPQRRS